MVCGRLRLKNKLYFAYHLLQNTKLDRIYFRTMSNSDHLSRTEAVPRNPVKSNATVTKITNISRTVKQLQVQIHNKELSFKAGQWVDFFIPNVNTVGGFSMCSASGILKEKGYLDLAVKYSTHPPALWVHSECRVGSEVQVLVGGDFYTEPPYLQDKPMVFIAGGVGINPLMSMLLDVIQSGRDKGKPSILPPVMFFYSAKTEEELIFRKELECIANEHSSLIKIKMFVTNSTVNCETQLQNSSPFITEGRINQECLSKNLEDLGCNRENINSYICGPSDMIDTMKIYLNNCGLHNNQIHFEKWW